jgi:hypothetical protein
MKQVYTNEPVVRRNARIAQIGLLAGLVVLAGGMFISFRYPELFNLSLAALLLGFILSQVGIYFSNRWGRRPRPDELIDQSLKGLDTRYRLYHYYKPVSHLLVGPNGVWDIHPQYQRGRITFENGRWRQRGGNWYMKLFAQESLGRPDMEVKADKQTVAEFLSTLFPEDGENIPVQSVLVFTNPATQVDVAEDAEAPANTVALGKLKELVRKKGKGKPLSADKALIIHQAILPEAREEQEEVEE